MNHREYEFSTRWCDSEDLWEKYIRPFSRTNSNGYEVRYETVDDYDWLEETGYEPRAYIDKWLDVFNSLGHVSFKNGSEICVAKDLGEFNADGTDVRSLFESCEVVHEK